MKKIEKFEEYQASNILDTCFQYAIQRYKDQQKREYNFPHPNNEQKELKRKMTKKGLRCNKYIKKKKIFNPFSHSSHCGEQPSKISISV